MKPDIRVQIAVNIRRIRSEKSVSASELARKSGISKATLSKLESGTGNPTIETLQSLVSSLDVSLEEILTNKDSRMRVVRAREQDWVKGSAVSMRSLDRLSGRSVVDAYESTFAKGIRRESEGHMAGTLEHMFVTAGRLLAGPVDEATELEAGDFARYPADGPHLYEALGGDAQAVLLISYTQAPSGDQEMQRELEHMLSTGDSKPTYLDTISKPRKEAPVDE